MIEHPINLELNTFYYLGKILSNTTRWKRYYSKNVITVVPLFEVITSIKHL